MNEQEFISINNYLIDIFKSHKIAIEKEENGWINFSRRNDAPFYAYQSRQPKIRGDVVLKRQSQNYFTVQIDVLLQLLDGRILCESFVGMGDDEHKAIENGLANFLLSSFHVLTNAFYFQKDEQIEIESWEINGEKWRVFVGNAVGRGDSSEISAQMPEDVFPMLEKLIKSQNLNEESHWFRLFYANFDNKEIECEVLFDNEVWQEAVDKIKNCNWEKRTAYYTFRNFVVLVNEDYYASKSFVLDGKNRNSFSERLIEMQLGNLVATSVKLFRKHRDLEDFDLLKVFVDNGIPLDISRRLIEFTPIAFGRVFLENLGANLTEYYERIDVENGKVKVIEKSKLAENPIYAQALKFAQNEVNYDYDKDNFLLIAWRSAEMQAMNEACDAALESGNVDEPTSDMGMLVKTPM